MKYIGICRCMFRSNYFSHNYSYSQSTDAPRRLRRNETVWTTRTVEQPVSHTTTGEPSIGDLVAGGLIGSTLGNNITDAHVRHRRCYRRHVDGNKFQLWPEMPERLDTSQKVSVIHAITSSMCVLVGNISISSDRPYQVRERVKLHVQAITALWIDFCRIS